MGGQEVHRRAAARSRYFRAFFFGAGFLAVFFAAFLAGFLAAFFAAFFGAAFLAAAFLAAGAHSTVTTMWRVADEPTADFMQVFYHYLGRREPRDQALRRAKLRFLNDRSDLSDPHYWAAFLLTGDGFRPVPRAVTWRELLALAIGISIAGAFGARLYRRRKKSVPR